MEDGQPPRLPFFGRAGGIFGWMIHLSFTFFWAVFFPADSRWARQRSQ
jgi:hypothetical protein